MNQPQPSGGRPDDGIGFSTSSRVQISGNKARMYMKTKEEVKKSKSYEVEKYEYGGVESADNLSLAGRTHCLLPGGLGSSDQGRRATPTDRILRLARTVEG